MEAVEMEKFKSRVIRHAIDVLSATDHIRDKMIDTPQIVILTTTRKELDKEVGLQVDVKEIRKFIIEGEKGVAAIEKFLINKWAMRKIHVAISDGNG